VTARQHHHLIFELSDSRRVEKGSSERSAGIPRPPCSVPARRVASRTHQEPCAPTAADVALAGQVRRACRQLSGGGLRAAATLSGRADVGGFAAQSVPAPVGVTRGFAQPARLRFSARPTTSYDGHVSGRSDQCDHHERAPEDERAAAVAVTHSEVARGSGVLGIGVSLEVLLRPNSSAADGQWPRGASVSRPSRLVGRRAGAAEMRLLVTPLSLSTLRTP
jgi:hypothetical protein